MVCVGRVKKYRKWENSQDWRNVSGVVTWYLEGRYVHVERYYSLSWGLWRWHCKFAYRPISVLEVVLAEKEDLKQVEQQRRLWHMTQYGIEGILPVNEISIEDDPYRNLSICIVQAVGVLTETRSDVVSLICQYALSAAERFEFVHNRTSTALPLELPFGAISLITSYLVRDTDPMPVCYVWCLFVSQLLHTQMSLSRVKYRSCFPSSR